MIIQLVNSVFTKFGFEIKDYIPGVSYWASLERMLVYHGIDLVLDVGANTGQFAIMLRKCGYKGQIVSFEPLLAEYEQLVRQAAKDPLWTVAPRMAIGDIDGEVSINVSANSVSSSIAGMLDAHLEAAPESFYVGSEKVPIARLDTLAGKYVPSTSRAFLKIDTQGYELQVLAGAKQLVPSLKGLQVELSLMPLYEGGGMFCETVRMINDFGFELYGLFDSFTDKRTGRMLQTDGIFFRSGEERREPETAEKQN
jgi:FkbM family methyltransferase